MKIKSKQIIVINSLRGIASLSVCLYHFVCTTTGYITNETILDIFSYGKKGVQLFFIISGIVIPLSMLNSNYKINLIGKYLLKRFVRIEPPYIAAVLLGTFYLYIRNFISTSTQVDLTPTVGDFFLHIGYLVPFVEGAKWINPVFWTLSVEFQYYLFLAFLFPLALSKRTILNWVFNGIVITLPLLISSTEYYPHWSAYFGIGIFYALYKSKKQSFKDFIICIATSLTVVYLEQGVTDLIIALITISIIHFLPNLKFGVGLFLGEISYSLYLVHSIIGAAFINYMSHRFTSTEGKFMVILCGVIISIVSAYFFWKIIERPSQIKSKKIRINGVTKNIQKSNN